MELSSYIKIIDDFPSPGISFKDMSPLLADRRAFKAAVEQLSQLAKNYQPDLIVGPEARGFIFGTPLAYELGLGFVMARKDGKLPGEVLKMNYDLEYGSAALTVPKNLIRPGSRILLVDDLLATGGTLIALAELLTAAGARPVAALTLIELTDLGGRSRLGTLPYHSLIKYRS